MVEAGSQTRRLASDVCLLDAFLREPLSENVGHSLRREGDVEWEFGVVPRHRRDVLNRR